MGFLMYYAYKGAPGPKPAGASIYPYGPFETGDGRPVMHGIQSEREWAVFCARILQDEGLAADSRVRNNSLRVENREELRVLIYKAFSNLAASEAVARLDDAGIANAKANDMHGVWDHPQLRARGRWVEISTPAGGVPVLVPPGAVSRTDGAAGARMNAVPKVGEHNEAILAELGLDESG